VTVSVRKRPFFIPCSVTFVNEGHAPGDFPGIKNTGYFIQFIGYFENTKVKGLGLQVVTYLLLCSEF
jgi:hypothetical protein